MYNYIDLQPTDPKGPDANSDQWVTVSETKLTNSDKEILQSDAWLNDKHITAAQCLLKSQYPTVLGLQNPMLQCTRTFAVHHDREFVQCLNMSHNHWITISTVGCVPGLVNVYDSLHLRLPTSLKCTIADLLHTNEGSILVQYMHMQDQGGGSDCGLFAIATATTICNGQDPAALQFDQSHMRQHLLNAFETNILMPFPSRKVAKRKPLIVFRERIHVYCVCRHPDDGRKMVQCTKCKSWYHCDCMKLAPNVLKNIENTKTPWYCQPSCT